MLQFLVHMLLYAIMKKAQRGRVHKPILWWLEVLGRPTVPYHPLFRPLKHQSTPRRSAWRLCSVNYVGKRPFEDGLKYQRETEWHERSVETIKFKCFPKNESKCKQETLLVGDSYAAKIQLTYEDANEEILFTRHTNNDDEKTILERRRETDDDKSTLIHHSGDQHENIEVSGVRWSIPNDVYVNMNRETLNDPAHSPYDLVLHTSIIMIHLTNHSIPRVLVLTNQTT